MPGDAARTTLADLEAEQRRLREMLAAADPAVLAQRPPNGKWSVIENVRLLVFAEQLHVGRLAAGGIEWSPLGLAPHNMAEQRRLRMVGTAATTDMGEVLRAWDAVHATARPLLERDTDEVAHMLERHLRHLRAHVKVIERLLRRPA
jgi:hypothetical protein